MSSNSARRQNPQASRPKNNFRSSNYGAPPPYRSGFSGSVHENLRPDPRQSSPSETDPLFSGSPSFQQKKSPSAKFWLFLVFLVGVVIIWSCTDLFNPSVWKSRRRDYQLDRDSWEKQRKQWVQDNKNHLEEVAQWDEDRRVFNKERAQIVLERDALDKELLKWTEKRDRYEMERRELEQEKEHMRVERSNHQRELEQWKDERNKREIERENLKHQIAEDRRLRDVEREEWDRERRQHEDDRIPPGAFWEERIKSATCHSYGKREYSAQLSNIPSGWTPMQACLATPTEFHGVSIRRPDRCEYSGYLSRDVIGHWLINFDETECQPWHADWHDTGCTNEGSETRRIEAQVRGIRDEDNWEVMCGTTPATLNHVNYGRPTHCSNRRWGRKVAMWDLKDPTC